MVVSYNFSTIFHEVQIIQWELSKTYEENYSTIFHEVQIIQWEISKTYEENYSCEEYYSAIKHVFVYNIFLVKEYLYF